MKFILFSGQRAHRWTAESRLSANYVVPKDDVVSFQTENIPLSEGRHSVPASDGNSVSVVVWSNPRGGWTVELPYDWGDQPASHYLRIGNNGDVLEDVSGTGEHAPIPRTTGEFISLWEDAQEASRQREEELKSSPVGQSANEIFRRLSADYNRGINPLKWARRTFGGKWEYSSNPVEYFQPGNCPDGTSGQWYFACPGGHVVTYSV